MCFYTPWHSARDTTDTQHKDVSPFRSRVVRFKRQKGHVRCCPVPLSEGLKKKTVHTATWGRPCKPEAVPARGEAAAHPLNPGPCLRGRLSQPLRVKHRFQTLKCGQRRCPPLTALAHRSSPLESRSPFPSSSGAKGSLKIYRGKTTREEAPVPV